MINPKDEEWLLSLGKRIKGYREKKGLSLRKLADMADIDFGQLYKIEKGETNPSVSIIKSIADALGVKMGKIFDF